jgi:hypothetical protein
MFKKHHISYRKAPINEGALMLQDQNTPLASRGSSIVTRNEETSLESDILKIIAYCHQLNVEMVGDTLRNSLFFRRSTKRITLSDIHKCPTGDCYVATKNQ